MNSDSDSSKDEENNQEIDEELLHEIEQQEKKQFENELTELIISGSYDYDRLFKNYPDSASISISKKDRILNNFYSSSLSYGEIRFFEYARIFCQLYQYGLEREGLIGKFVDIGCGIGKAVFTTALLHDFKFIVGIEILESLSKICEKNLLVWQEELSSKFQADKKQIDFKFINADATHVDWHDADVVFIGATCFTPEMMNSLAAIANKMRSKSFVITVTLTLPSKYFELLDVLKMQYNWGYSTVYIYKHF